VKKIASTTDPLWYKDAVIYELHVRAFVDSNGDGIGDFPGLISRLDYLQELGVTCIWLLPFFPSPLRDDGYDIANYVDVNPSYGTLDDFKMFIDAAHERNMQVMIELVINHTSDQHPWFKAAQLAAPGSPAREMYVWSETDQRYKDARIIFTDTEKSNWTWDETAHAYYWHRFFAHQPDLNFDNPAVLEEVLKAMRFWLDLGVDALRIDAIPYLVERDGTTCENLPQTHEIVKKIRAAIDAEYANRLVLAEANQWPADVRPYFGEGDECHMAFHFPLMPRIYMALRQEDRQPIIDIMAQTPPIPESCQWGLFLRNHDELTLEMVTDDERDYMYFAYSSDPHMRVNVGIRRRLAPLVDNNRRRIELLNSLLLSFPGTPILYYGDELGMGDNIYLGDRNGVRTPMQWNSDRNAGFSRCDPARLYLPVVMDPIYGYQAINVEAQLSDPSSLLHWTQNMIALRKLFQVFGRGSLRFLNPTNRKILAYLRDLDRGDGSHETVLCVANLSRFAQPVSLDLSDYIGFEPVEMIGYVSFPAITDAPYALTLAPYSFLWLELQPANVQGMQTSVPAPDAFPQSVIKEPAAIELLEGGWSGLLARHGSALLEDALPAWLIQQRWFGAKTRTIASVRVKQWAEFPRTESTRGAEAANSERDGQGIPPALFFIEIHFVEGAPDLYQVPLALSVGSSAEELQANCPHSVVVNLASESGPMLLHDATTDEDFRKRLLSMIASEETQPLSSSVELTREDAENQRTIKDNAPSPNTKNTEPREGRPDTQPMIDSEPSMAADLAAGIPVAPLPLTAQPGEAARDANGDLESGPHDEKQHKDEVLAQSPVEADSVKAHATAAFAQESHLDLLLSRVGSAEQSNTSILYGEKFILKLFRRIEPGKNPDVEIGRFLTEVAHFDPIAPLLGDIEIFPSQGEPTTIAMLQALVPNVGDGWQWFLDELHDFYLAINSLPAPPAAAPPKIGQVNVPSSEAIKHAQSTIEAGALLGRRTAEMHLALSTPTNDPDFCAESMSAADLAVDAEHIRTQIIRTLAALKMKFANLDDNSADASALLLSRRSLYLATANSLAGLRSAGQRIRIHGDYHLGQTLRTEKSKAGTRSERRIGDGDFVLLDFEGEPARSLDERRKKQSPLKDVAGMMRSISYAAQAGLKAYSSDHETTNQASGPDDKKDTAVEAWAQWWERTVAAQFLRTYMATITAVNPTLLPPSAQAQIQLDSYLLEKAMYELLYELNNRPDWLSVPLGGILTL